MSIKPWLACGVAVTALALHPHATAQKRYDPGASETEIKIGQTMAYSGPASAFGALGRTEAAYFNVMRQAASLKNFATPYQLPGITLNTSPTDFAPTKSMQPVRFDGKTWVHLGDVLGL